MRERPAAVHDDGRPVSALFVSYSGLFGGSERILLDVATGLAATRSSSAPRGISRTARARRACASSPSRSAASSCAPPRATGSPRRCASAALAREVRALTRSLRPEVVFGWGTRAAVSCAVGLAGLEPRPRFIFQNNDILQGPRHRARWRARRRGAPT